MFLPISTEVVISRLPLGNILIIGICVAVFIMELGGVISPEQIHALASSSANPSGMITSLFLHADLWHLAGNMLFLWVFGNAVCERLGSLRFIAIFLLCGALADLPQMYASPLSSIGASGAIFGIIGFYLAMYPINKITYASRFGEIILSGYWIILFWFGMNLWGAFMDRGSMIGYFSHIGGFVSGLPLGLLFLKMKWVTLAEYDNPSLADYISQWLAPDKQEDRKHSQKQKLAEELEPEVEPAIATPEETPKPRMRLPLAPLPENPPTPEKPKAPEPVFEAEDEPAPQEAPILKPLAKLDDVELECPYCSAPLSVSPLMLGKKLLCPSCEKELELTAG